jgi:hypothetical protein
VESDADQGEHAQGDGDANSWTGWSSAPMQ